MMSSSTSNKTSVALEKEMVEVSAVREEVSVGSTENQDSTTDRLKEGIPAEDATPRDARSPLKKRKTGLHIFFMDIGRVLKLDELGSEIASIAIPAALALAADPLASLIDTAFIGRLGSVEIAAVGVSIAIFNQVSKVAIYPLVSVTTSFVAEEEATCSEILKTNDLEKGPAAAGEVKELNLCECGSKNDEQESKDLEKASPLDGAKELSLCDGKSLSTSGETECRNAWTAGRCVNICGLGHHQRRYIPSVSSALVVGGALGLILSIFLIFAAKVALGIMGVKSGSPMLAPAYRYLTLRSLGAPAVLLSLAMQGVFRGFKDTKTPLYATVAGDLTNIILDPIFIFTFHMGVSGAAIAHVTSQYLITLILLCRLVKRVDVIPPSIKSLKLSRFLKCGFMLLARVIAATFCVTLAASLAARHGSVPMAAFQICLQLWMSTSLLADGLAVAGQAVLASSFAKGDLHKVVAATSRVLQLSIVLGLALAVFLGVGIEFGSGIFTKDMNVVKLIHKALPFVAATQPINSLAFVFDGVNFGASDYTYSAYSMVLVAVISVLSLVFLSLSRGFIGIWIALTIYMTLRALAGIWRMGAARGPWTFLRR